MKEVGLGWINEGRIDHGFGWEKMVLNSYFEDLDGRVGLKSGWEFAPKAGKNRNERIKVGSDS